MTTSRQRILWTGLLASVAFAASAQTPPPPAAPQGATPAAQHRMHKPNDGKFAERMQEHRAKQQAALKAKLKLNASQEGAWTTFTGATQPPAPPAQRPDRAEFEKLTTPQRLDRMQQRQAEHTAMSAKYADATRAFYATLTPEQQKTFDTETLRHGPRGDRHGPRGGHRAPPAKG